MSARPPVNFLERLSDVDITSAADGEGLIFNSGTMKWENLAIPGGTLETLSDVLIGTPSDGQVLVYSTASSKWINYGPLAFTDITGNLAVAQLAGGSGADATTYFRGDNTWGAPPTGAIAVTASILMGDAGGNAIASALSDSLGNYLTYGSSYNGLTRLLLTNPNAGTAAGSGLELNTSAGVAGLYKMGGSTTAGTFTPLSNTYDALIVPDGSGLGNLIIASDNNIIIGKHATATERVRINNGIMAGLTVDKGTGTINVSSGYYVNGNKIGGVAVVTSTVDQTSTSETVHVSYTVPANTVVVGTVFRIAAWGNMDNSTTAITYTPRIRWGGTAGTQLIATPTITSTTTAGTNRDWTVTARVIVRSIGASGTAVCELSETNHTVTALPGPAADQASSGATAITIDTTAAKDICLTWTMSSPAGTPHVRTFGGGIEILEA